MRMAIAILWVALAAVNGHADAQSRSVHLLYATGILDDRGFCQLWDIVRNDGDAALHIQMAEPKEFEKALGIHYDFPELHTHAEVMDTVRRLDRLEIPFYFGVYCPYGPHVNAATAEEILHLPRCRGLVMGEAYNSRLFALDANWSLVLRFVELARRAGKKMVWIEHRSDGPHTFDWHSYHGTGWIGFQLNNHDLFRLFINDRYRETIVPCFETNECGGTPDLMTLFGGWCAGQTAEWGWSVQSWYWQWAWHTCLSLAEQRGWSDYRKVALQFAPLPPEGKSWREVNDDEICRRHPPDLILRTLLAANSLGATYFQFEPGSMIVRMNDGNLQPAPQYAQGIRPFLRLLQTGLVATPSSPQAVETRAPLQFLATSREAHVVRDGVAMGAWELGPFTYWWFGQRAGNQYFPSYAFGETDFYESLLPRTDFGMIGIFPQEMSPRMCGARILLETNGGQVWREGRPLDAAQIQKLLRESKGSLPFRADGVFLSAVRMRDRVRLYLINPRVSQPGEVTTELRIPLEPQARLVDAVSGAALPVSSGAAHVVIPLGGYRILDWHGSGG